MPLHHHDTESYLCPGLYISKSFVFSRSPDPERARTGRSEIPIRRRHVVCSSNTNKLCCCWHAQPVVTGASLFTVVRRRTDGWQFSRFVVEVRRQHGRLQHEHGPVVVSRAGRTFGRNASISLFVSMAGLFYNLFSLEIKQSLISMLNFFQ